MRLPRLRSAVPPALKARVSLERGERILGWSWLPDQGWVVATDRALKASAVDLGSDQEPFCLAWTDIIRVRWADGSLEVVTDDGAGAQERLVFAIGEPGLLAEAVRTLVTGSIVMSTRIEDAPERSATFLARRASDDNGINWTVAFDPHLDPTDPDLRAWADEHLGRLKEQTGL